MSMENLINAFEKMDLGSDCDEIEKMDVDADDSCGNEAATINDYVIVDLQGYRNRHRFICKEFCLIDGDYRYHAVIKSPEPFKKMMGCYRRHADWAIKNFHGLSAESGDVHINEVIEKIWPKIANKKIIVRHFWKIPWLRYVFRNCGAIDCIWLENLNVDVTIRSKDEYSYDFCDFHSQHGWDNWKCALAIALEVKDILDMNLR